MLMLGTDYSTTFTGTEVQAKVQFGDKLHDAIIKITAIRNSKPPEQYTALDRDTAAAALNDTVDFFNGALTHYGSLSWYDYGKQMLGSLTTAAKYVTGQALAYQMAPKIPMPTDSNASSSPAITAKPNYLLWGGIAAGAVVLYLSMR